MSATTRAATVLAAAGAAGWTVHRLARRSGVTADETRKTLPGDEIVARPLWESTRGITIAAPPAAVWPWIVQMGYPTHRAGWYTPHWLDELMWGERPFSADRVVSELQGLKVGDRVPDSDDWSVFYVVDQLEPDSHLVLHSTSHNVGPIETADFSWAFVLLPVAGGVGATGGGVKATGSSDAAASEGASNAGATRLLVRARVAYTPALLYPLVETVVGLGDWVNVSVMLRGVRERAERPPAQRPAAA